MDDVNKNIKAEMQQNARRELQSFIDRSLAADRASWHVAKPEQRGATPVYVVTGASTTPYDPKLHGEFTTHSFSRYAPNNEKYLLNNTGAIAEQLLDQGARIILHVKDADLAKTIFKDVGADKIHIISGDLGDKQVVSEIYQGLARFGQSAPISNIGLALYQSFAQQGGMPFKPMHIEDVETVEGAANKRLRFVYNMAAMSYDMLMNKGVDDLRIVSLSALASNRATYGLLADAADKYMNELAWRTFYLEARALTGKDVTYFQVNPGITTACEVYKQPEVKRLVREEALADGFPFSSDIMAGKAELPQISADNVALVSNRLLTAQNGTNPNKNLPPYIQRLLYAGYEPGELRAAFSDAVTQGDQKIDINLSGQLPEHIITSATSHGALPEKIESGMYRRIMLTPPGQKF